MRIDHRPGYSTFVILRWDEEVDKYWKDEGQWGVGFKNSGKDWLTVDVSGRHPLVDNCKLTKATMREWREDNEGMF